MYAGKLLPIFVSVVLVVGSLAEDGCHGPSWCHDPCQNLPFSSVRTSTTPAEFSHADQYRIEVTRAMSTATGVFFYLTFKVVETACALHVGLIPPPSPSPNPAVGGIQTVLFLGGTNSSSKSIPSIFSPTKNLSGIGNWTLLVSTMPKQPCKYHVEVLHLAKPSVHFPATIVLDSNTDSNVWVLVEFTAALSEPMALQITGQNCELNDVEFYMAASEGIVHGTVGSLEGGILVNTLGAAASTYVAGFQDRKKSLSSCSLRLVKNTLHVVPLVVNGKPHPFSDGNSFHFRVPFSPARPFTKLTVVGTSKEAENDIQYMFYGDSFHAGGVARGTIIGEYLPGIFSEQGSPTMFVPDNKKDAEQEDYLFTIEQLSNGGAIEGEITLYATKTTRMEIGTPVQGSLSAGPTHNKTTGAWLPPRSLSTWFVGEINIQSTNSSGPIITVKPAISGDCSFVNIGIRSGCLPNGPFGGVPWDRTNTTLSAEHGNVYIDLRKGFIPPPFSFSGPVYIFIDNGYGKCTFDVSVHYE